MDPTALADCLTTASCLVTQATSGLISGLILFLVAAGLTLIFGVLGVVNFAHGSFYMAGAYLAYTVYGLSGSFTLAIIGGTAGMALGGIVFEQLLLRRIYSANVMMQLLVCYAVILIGDDLVKIVWGPDFISMGMPEAFQVPPLFVAGGIIPLLYLLLGGIALGVAILLSVVLEKTRTGKIIRAAAVNPTMVSSLGINTVLLYALVVAVGAGLAGLAGALAAPVRSMTPGMGFSILIDSFVVTVIGGMGSIPGALIVSILLGLVQAFGAVGFPLFTDQIFFIFMILILVLRPAGLLGREVA